MTEQNWIGQARALAAQHAPALEPETPQPSNVEQLVEQAHTPKALPKELGSRQRNATFTVELLLGMDGEVRHTSVAHVQSGHRELQKLCSGWDPARLLGYMVERAGLRVAEPSQGAIEVWPALELATQRQPDLSGAPTLRELAVVPAGDDRPRNVLHHDQTFQLQLALDLAGVSIPAGQPLSYAATVLAKRMGSGTREKLGEACGQTPPTDTLALDIKAENLTEGLYRLEAIVDLGVISDTTEPQPTHKTQLRGGLLQIY